MNLSNENGDLILKVLGAILSFFSLRWIVKLFSGADKKLNLKEFKDLVAFGLFIWAFVYILITEANRPASSEHVFSETWIFFIITALLSVLAKNEIFDSFSHAIELLIKLRTKVPYEPNPHNRPTPGQRLRAVLYRLWEQQPEGYKDSESHYRAKMESIIETFKSNLE